MSPETRKEVLVEYPVDVVYDTLIYLFPVRSYNLEDNDDSSHTVKVLDSSNYSFVMYIKVTQNSPNTTIINFSADYPMAAADLTGGGKVAIDTVLEELLNELDKQPKPGPGVKDEYNSDRFEVVNAQNFVNPAKNDTKTLSVIAGYVLCIVSFVLCFMALGMNDRSTMATVFVVGFLCFTFAMSISFILQFAVNPKPVMHGMIQACLCGLFLIILGYLIHPALAIVGILIPAISIGYTLKNRK